MKFNKSKFILALVCVTAGWTVGFFMGRNSGLRMARHSLISMGPFSFSLPFSNLDQDEMQQDIRPGEEDSFELRDLFKSSPDIFEKWFKNHKQGSGLGGLDPFGGNNSSFFTAHEDENFIYYEFDAAGMDKDSLNVKVENGMIIVEGEKSSNSANSSFKSKIYKTFPIPPGMSEENVKMSNEGSKIIVKFPKHGV